MTPTRRKWLSITTAVGVTATSGCLDGIIADSEDSSEEDSGSENESDSDADSEDEAEDLEDETEDSEDEAEDEPTRLEGDLNEIIDEVRWFATEYDSAIDTYREEIENAVDAVNELLDSLEDSGSLSMDEYEAASDDLSQIADSITAALYPHFDDSIFNFSGLNHQYLSDLESYIEFSDWPAAEQELKDFRSSYQALATGRSISNRYSDSPIDNRLYDWLSGEDDDHLFEIRFIKEDNTIDSDDDEPGFARYVTDNADRDITHTPFSTSPPRRSLTEARRWYDPVSSEHGRESQLHLNIHPIGQGEIDTSETEYDSLYIQRYSDVETAETALDQLLDREDEADVVLNGKREFGDETWDQIGYMINGDRKYSYLKQAGVYLVVLEPSRDIWHDHENDHFGSLPETFVLPELD